MSYQSEFGSAYDIEPVIPRVFKDISWHNDMCPSFIQPDADPTEPHVRLWIEHPDKAQRESRDSSRYTVAILSDDVSQCRNVYEGDDLSQAMECMNRYHAILKGEIKE